MSVQIDNSSKLHLVRQQLSTQQADVFLFVAEQNRFWLTGFASSAGYLLVSPKQCDLFVDGRYLSAAKDCAQVDSVFSLNTVDDVGEYLKKIKASTVLVEGEYMTVATFESLQKQLPNVSFLPVISSRLRAVKTDLELAKIRTAAQIVCTIANELQNYLKPGMSELDVSKWISRQILDKAEKNSFDPIVASGINGANPHHHVSAKKLIMGEFVTCDFGCIFDHYCSDLTRTYVIGRPTSQRMINLYQTVYQANQKGIAVASNELTGAQVHQVCADLINQTEFKGHFVHGTGHGVGLDVHEYPYVAKVNEQLLKTNAVVTIEPGIYVNGLGGARIEDMIIIKNNSNEQITKLAKVMQL